MQDWAKRIKFKLDAGRPSGLSQLGLAKACKKSQPSINQWFNDADSKPATVMIMADNLMAAAKYLGTSPTWIMTGKEDLSHLQRLNSTIIAATIRRMRETTGTVEGESVDIESDLDLFTELLRLTILEEQEDVHGEQGIRGATGQSSGAPRVEGAEKAGKKSISTRRRPRKYSSSVADSAKTGKPRPPNS